MEKLGAQDFQAGYRSLVIKKEKRLKKVLHAALNTGAMVTEGTTKDSVKLVHSLLGWWLCP